MASLSKLLSEAITQKNSDKTSEFIAILLSVMAAFKERLNASNPNNAIAAPLLVRQWLT